MAMFGPWLIITSRDPFGGLRRPSIHTSRLSLTLSYSAQIAKMGNANSQLLENIVQGSNFDREEVDRLRKRFMKLDKVTIYTSPPLEPPS